MRTGAAGGTVFFVVVVFSVTVLSNTSVAFAETVRTPSTSVDRSSRSVIEVVPVSTAMPVTERAVAADEQPAVVAQHPVVPGAA